LIAELEALERALAKGADIVLPNDVTVAHECCATARADIGPATIQRFEAVLAAPFSNSWKANPYRR
jgi:hypothetical protein